MKAFETRKNLQMLLGVEADGKLGSLSRTAFERLASAPADSEWPGGGAAATPPQPVSSSDHLVDDRSEQNIKTLLPQVQPIARKLIQTLLANGINAKIISGSRTFSEQDAIYAQGRTKPGNIVTNARAGYSWHNYGVAIDIGIFVDGKYLDDSPLYRKAGQLGKSIGFEWGGDWAGKLVDEPHLQYNPNHVSLTEARALHDQGKTIL